MSGIYIKGMEMPKSCWCCRFELNNMCRATINRMRVQSCDRHPDCPLIEVPKHGRLIDADALKESIKEARKTQPEIADVYDDDYFLVAEWLASAPTIIPADKGGE